jgi:polysaccharide deacetylase family protein (PEP-CTERM system associated)
MTPQEFKEDLQRSIEAINRAAGVRIRGYRAPTFSAQRDREWIWDAMLDCGIEYDSSIFPVKHDLYGDPTAPRFPYFMSFDKGTIFEIPPITYKILGKTLPAGGGGSFRMFPYWFTKHAINAYNMSGYAAVVYLHPWEIDPAQPRETANRKGRFRHYTNLHRVEAKLRKLLSDFKFGAVADIYPDLTAFYKELAERGVRNG